MNYAQIDASGRVVGVTQTAGEVTAPNMIPIAVFDASLIGSVYEGGVFTTSAPASVRHITRLAFRNRFTSAEKVAIEIAQLDNPAAPMPARAQAAALRASQADVAAASFVDLDRPDTRAGVQSLEAAGLLAEGRALAILDAPIQPEERPL